MPSTLVQVPRTRTPLTEAGQRQAELAMLRQYRSRLAREIAEIDRELESLAD
ncbi:MAG: hypothetical protein ACKVVT_18845 [Dehalococcoidia bacterium]